MVDNIHKKAAFCVVPYWGQGLPEGGGRKSQRWQCLSLLKDLQSAKAGERRRDGATMPIFAGSWRDAPVCRFQ